MSQITITGISLDSLSTIVADLTASMQTIYGADINVDSNSPDGQMINIVAQTVTDTQQVILDAYNSFSPDGAYGVVLDQRVALNGIKRNAGTYTVTPISVTADRILTLIGQDALVANPNAVVFTVQDDTGNQFQLVTSYTFSGAGTASLSFKAATIGKVQTTLNTITTQTTVVLGVTAVNNPLSATTAGTDEETDVALKIRRAKSFKLAAVGPADSILAALLDAATTPGVTDAYIVEDTAAHTVQAIVNGGTDAAVAKTIYTKKAPGCGMVGATSVVVSRPQGNSMTVKFDRAVSQSLYVRFALVSIGGATWDVTTVKSSLAAALIYTLGQTPSVGDVFTALKTIVPGAYAVSMAVSSDGSSWVDSVSPSDAKHYYVADASRVTIS